MDITAEKLLLGAGATSNAQFSNTGVYAEDLFSTYLYTGNNTANTNINNGIDLANEGGFVWTKSRDSVIGYRIVDSMNGVQTYLDTSNANGKKIDLDTQEGITAFNTNGYTLGASVNEEGFNKLNDNYVSWAFKKRQGFLDIVSYVGTGSTQTIAHNLGSAPGMIWIKAIDDIKNWTIYHRSLGNTQALVLNADNSATTDGGYFNNTDPTVSNFTVGGSSATNGSGKTFVAYIFANDDASFGANGNESIIKCGTYSGNSSENFIDLGFEPQFLIIKNSTSNSPWIAVDSSRKFPALTSEVSCDSLKLNTENAEDVVSNLKLNASGFNFQGTANNWINKNKTGENYIYMAIRRPHKPPASNQSLASDVFVVKNTFQEGLCNTGFSVDMILSKKYNGTESWKAGMRHLPDSYLKPDTTNTKITDTTNPAWSYDLSKQISINYGSTNKYVNYAFRRAPSFFDVVSYKGDGVNGRQITHNLGVVPELMIIKNHSNAAVHDWYVYYGENNKYVKLNDDIGNSTTSIWNNTDPTSSIFTLDNSNGVNKNYDLYLAWLFASRSGVSKIGTYTGNAFSAQQIDCGFQPQFIIIKKLSSYGDWYVYDVFNGISINDDNYLELNSDSSVQQDDHVNTFFNGFYVESSDVNLSNSEYLFFAIN